MKPHFNRGRFLLVLGLSGFITACASPGPRPEGLAQNAERAIEAARANDAREHAPVLLNQARNKLEDARELMEKKEYREARRLLEQAVVDAELATAKTETEQARIAARQLDESIKTLRQQLNERQT